MGQTRLISKAELSRLAGVTAAAITKACKARFKKAMKGKKINVDHPLIVEFIKNNAGHKTIISESRLTNVKRPKENGYHFAMDEYLSGMEDLTLQELVDQHGTDEQCRKWVETRKLIEEVRLKRLQVEEKSARLIPRELVQIHVLGLLEACNLRLLVDTPRTLSLRVVSMVTAGTKEGKVEEVIRAAISKQLKTAKQTITRILKKGE